MRQSFSRASSAAGDLPCAATTRLQLVVANAAALFCLSIIGLISPWRTQTARRPTKSHQLPAEIAVSETVVSPANAAAFLQPYRELQGNFFYNVCVAAALKNRLTSRKGSATRESLTTTSR